MNPLADLIQAIIEKICAEAGLDHDPIVSRLREEDLNYAEVLCQSLLGGFLEYGWSNGAKSDTPAIRVALMYSLYAGMVVGKNRDNGKEYSVEELFAQIEQNEGIMGWAESCLHILRPDADFKLAAKFTALVDAYVNYAAEPLPQKVASGEDAVVCVAACAAMYCIGQYHMYDQFEK